MSQLSSQLYGKERMDRTDPTELDRTDPTEFWVHKCSIENQAPIQNYWQPFLKKGGEDGDLRITQDQQTRELISAQNT